MLELTIKAATPDEMRLQLLGTLNIFKGIHYSREDGTPIDTRKIDPQETAEIAGEPTVPSTVPPVKDKPNEPADTPGPVISQAQMAENQAAAPEHTEPEQPPIEEVRAAMKALRDKKGSAAVKEILKAYGADSLPELKPEDYLGALARAKAEV